VPFRGMNIFDQPILVGGPERIEKLYRLAKHYGIRLDSNPGWGEQLAFCLAIDFHPGFKLVYDDWHVRAFKTLYGFTPLLPMKEGDKPRHRRKGTGWAPELSPEVFATFVDWLKAGFKIKGKKFTDRKACELAAVSFDSSLEKRDQQGEKKRRVDLLIRRLSKGRQLLIKKNKRL
jgi:hypothetical protein